MHTLKYRIKKTDPIFQRTSNLDLIIVHSFFSFLVNLQNRLPIFHKRDSIISKIPSRNELNCRPYERARGLHYYLLQARFYGYDQLSDWYEVKDNY